MRTAQTNLRLRNNGTPLTAGAFTTLDLVSGISATDAGSAVAAVTASGGGAGTNVATEVCAATQSGANITLDLTTLSHTVVAVEIIFRNGQNVTPVSGWSLSGSTVTVVNADAGDAYQVQYTY